MPVPDDGTTDADLVASQAPETRASAMAEVWRVLFFYVAVAALWIGWSGAWGMASPVKEWWLVGITAAALLVLLTRGVARRFRGIERERQTRAARDQAQALLRALVEGSPDAIFAKDRAGGYLLFNQALVRAAGAPNGLLIGQDDRDLFGAEQAAVIRANDEQVMAQGRPATFEEVLDVADGRRTFLATKGPLRDAEGRVIGLFGISRDITERSALEHQRQQALEAASQMRDLLCDVLTRIDDGCAALDLTWTFTYINPKGARLLGHEHADTLVGRHLWTEFPAAVGTGFHRDCLQAMRDQQPVVREDHYAPWNRWFEFRFYPSPQGLSIYFSDTTARRQAEHALQVSELRYRLAASQGQVWDWSADTGQLVVAPEFWQILELQAPTAERNRQVLEDLMHPDDLPHFRQALTAHLGRCERYELEFRVRHADGAWRWFRTQGQAVWNAQGRATYMAGTTFDITQRKQAEEDLRASEAYRRLVFEQLADGVLLIDHTLKVLDANAQAMAMLGYTRSELLARSLPDLLAEHERPRLQAETARLLSGAAHLDEWEHRRQDGSQFPAEVSVRPLDGQRHVQVLRDISVRRASERVLLTYQLELSELTRRLLEQEKQTTQRVAQSLHDHVGQTLAVVRLSLEVALANFGATMPDGLLQVCHGLNQQIDQAIREVRHVLTDLRPPMLEAQGLVAALDNEIRSRVVPVPGVDTGVGADVLIETTDEVAALRWPADVEYGVFMVAREAIANARQHAGASLIRVVLNADASGLELQVIDDGESIPARMLHGRPGHLGIVGMRERAIAIGARFLVAPVPDGGTRVSMRWEGAPT